MSEWKDCLLSNVLKFGNGKSRPKSFGKYPVYGGNGILDYCDNFNYENETIIIGRVGAYCGATYYEKNEVWVSDNALSAKSNVNNDTKFLYYFLKNLDLNQFAQGSSHPLLTQTLLNSIEVKITTNFLEQQAIASVLSSLDDKIDLLHRQNKTLEAMAETLFRQWFIEEAKDDWQYVNLSDVIETSSGGTPSRKNMNFYNNGAFNWVKSKELNGLFINHTEEKITEEAIKKSSAKLIPAYSTLVAMYGATVGEFALITKEMTCNQAICAIKPNENFPYPFIFSYIKSIKEELINKAVGSAQQNISQVLIKQMKVPNQIALIKRFSNDTLPVFQKIESNSKQIQTLENLRDTLLPKLMSAEIRVQHQT